MNNRVRSTLDSEIIHVHSVRKMVWENATILVAPCTAEKCLCRQSWATTEWPHPRSRAYEPHSLPFFRPFILVSIRVVCRRHSGRLYNYMWWIYLGLFNYITRFRYLYPPSSHVESVKPHKLSVYALDYDYCSHSPNHNTKLNRKLKCLQPSHPCTQHSHTTLSVVCGTGDHISCSQTAHSRRHKFLSLRSPYKS